MVELCTARNVLVVDDDLEVAETLIDFLKRHDVQAEAFSSRSLMLKFHHKFNPDFVILNIDPRHRGFDVLRDLRMKSEVPVIVVGPVSQDGDRIAYLEVGADDYLSKPISLPELLARMNAIFRRRFREPEKVAQPKPQMGKWLFAGFELRLKTRQLRNPAGEIVPLTNREFALLVALVEAAERPVSREYLLKSTRLYEDILDRSIDVQILRLRRKLEENASLPRMITTKRGVGYVFNLPVVRA